MAEGYSVDIFLNLLASHPDYGDWRCERKLVQCKQEKLTLYITDESDKNISLW